MTTTHTPLNETLKQELVAMKEGTIHFPYGASNELLQMIADETDGWTEMRARHELMIRKAGRSLVAVPMEDENGELILRNGKPVPEFVYTLGQGRKGLPEVLCFYPSTTIGHHINRLCTKLEAGEYTDEEGIIKVRGCFDADEDLEFLLVPLTGEGRQLAADKYACQCEDDEPLFLAIAPMPNGTYVQDFIPDGLF